MTNQIQTEVIQYKAVGTCCQMIHIQLFDGIIQDIQFMGGCMGNQQGIRALTKGLTINEVISKLSGIRCGDKDTSCPDQLAKALILYKNKRLNYKANETQDSQTSAEI